MVPQSPTTFPSSLPSWLRDWAEDCLACDIRTISYEDIRHFPALEAEGFKRMLSDPTVAEDLANLKCSDAEANQHDPIKEILATTCEIYHVSKSIVSKTPSVAKKELRALALSADRLAKSLYEQGRLIEPATNLRYLVERATTDNPNGFIFSHRAGLHRARYITREENVSLIDLLEAFAADINEELSLFPSRLDQLKGGSNAAVRWQIRFLKRAYCVLFGKPNNAVISHLLSAINDMPIDRDRVAKVRT